MISSGKRMMRNAGTDKAVRRVFVECTHLYQHNFNTGIQRVVRNLACLGGAEGKALGLDVRPVIITRRGLAEIPVGSLARGKSSAAVRVWSKVRKAMIGMVGPTKTAGGVAGAARDGSGAQSKPSAKARLKGVVMSAAVGGVLLMRALVDRAVLYGRVLMHWGNHVDVREGDVLLLADASWKTEVLWSHAENWRRRRGLVGIVVYDLIPIATPEFSAALLVGPFEKYMRRATASTDFSVAISKHSAHEFLAFARRINAPGWNEDRAGSFRLGADKWASEQKNASEDAKVARATLGERKFCLAVGTVEIRKNHAAILDAFDRLWADGDDVGLVIVGNYGWKSAEIAQRMRTHAEFGKRLFWFTGATDADLEMWYGACSAVVMASKAEGFGLPVVEALVRGRQVIASDIPTHREIADGFVEFFDPTDVGALVEAVKKNVRGELKEIGAYRWPGWPESVKEGLSECARMAALGRRCESR